MIEKVSEFAKKTYSFMEKFIKKGECKMIKFVKRFIKRRCDVVIPEVDLVKILRALNANRIRKNLTISECAFENGAFWTVKFDASERQWSSMVSELKKNGVSRILTEETDKFGRIYFREV